MNDKTIDNTEETDEFKPDAPLDAAAITAALESVRPAGKAELSGRCLFIWRNRFSMHSRMAGLVADEAEARGIVTAFMASLPPPPILPPSMYGTRQKAKRGHQHCCTECLELFDCNCTLQFVDDMQCQTCEAAQLAEINERRAAGAVL